ncbi:MAG TPA: FAD-binding oxidoreductase [Alphaproteobacteria bacterium]|nr:FAD-binding oxidoreductase [Alphaproteobacteria bacterium]
MTARLDTEVAIIGGGIGACSAALHLARRGVPALVLERDYAGAGASGVNFGGVRRNGRHLEELALAERALSGYWRRLEEWVGSTCEYAETGHLKCARNAEDAAELERHNAKAQDYGVPLEMLGRSELLERFPWLGPDAYAASWSPTCGQANPRLVGPAFARAARAAGAEIRERVRVVGAETIGSGFEIATEDGLSVRARVLLNCAGAWGAEVAAWFNERVPMRTITPQMVVTEPLPYVIEPVLGVVGGNLYLRQIPRGNVIFGGGDGVADLAAARSYVAPPATLESLRHAVRMVPHLARAHVIRVWTGLEGETPDGLPILGPSATTAGLFHSFGYSGHGFQLVPAAGAILAELVCEGATQTPIAPLAISRFRPAS